MEPTLTGTLGSSEATGSISSRIKVLLITKLTSKSLDAKLMSLSNSRWGVGSPDLSNQTLPKEFFKLLQ